MFLSNSPLKKQGHIWSCLWEIGLVQDHDVERGLKKSPLALYEGGEEGRHIFLTLNSTWTDKVENKLWTL
jgi:hypothetical protein